MSSLLTEIQETIIQGKGPVIKELTAKALDEGNTADEILQTAMIPGMTEVGRRMKVGENFIPEVLISARTMQMALEVLKPHLKNTDRKNVGTVVLGTVAGDLHDIGKNLVAMMFEGAGYKVIDLGYDVGADKFVTATKEHQANIVAMSALITTTMAYMEDVIEAFQEAGIRDKVKVLVGGAPVTPEFADKIKADGYAKDAASAVDVAAALYA